MTIDLHGYICLVTGGSRGLGQGIATALGQAGATVYITGKTLDAKDGDGHESSHSLRKTAQMIEDAGGKAIPVAVDHSDDNQVAGLFGRIRREQHGCLDLVVNNAFEASSHLLAESTKPDHAYWQATGRSPMDGWDKVNRVGLRNVYTCCVLATRLMVECRSASGEGEKERPTGVICNISSIGAVMRMFDVPFCAGKSAIDRMSLEMANDLRRHNMDIVVFSLVPGVVRTDSVLAAIESGREQDLRAHWIDLSICGTLARQYEQPIVIEQYNERRSLTHMRNLLSEYHKKLMPLCKTIPQLNIGSETSILVSNSTKNSLRIGCQLNVPISAEMTMLQRMAVFTSGTRKNPNRATKMPPVLGYWKIRGLAQPIRYLMEYLGVEYTEKLYGPAEKDEWFDKKFSLGLDLPNDNLKKSFDESIPKLMEMWSGCLGKRKFLIGSEVQYVDFIFFENLDVFLYYEPKCLDAFPSLKAYYDRMKELPKLKAYLNSDRCIHWPCNGWIAKWGGAGNPPQRHTY